MIILLNGRYHGLETEAASLAEASAAAAADWTVRTDMLGEEGPSPLDPPGAWWWWWWLIKGVLV